ncbi:hypothetical protein MHK_005801 [Candidatus Magnetomorum sp. HK-1]|nr:hypothetical protein MHK_005801 [Candidatus Magnetomorum sp. HK-1]
MTNQNTNGRIQRIRHSRQVKRNPAKPARRAKAHSRQANVNVIVSIVRVGANLVFALELKTFANNCSRANIRFAPTLALGKITFSLSLTAMG